MFLSCQSVLLSFCLSHVLFIPRGNFYFIDDRNLWFVQAETLDRFIENSTANNKNSTARAELFVKIESNIKICNRFTRSDSEKEFMKKAGNSKVYKLL